MIRDARELRVKNGRIAAVAEVTKLGGGLFRRRTDDHRGMQAWREELICPRDHHAMSLAVAALRAEGPVTITESECTNISYPGFWQDLAGLQKGAAG